MVDLKKLSNWDRTGGGNLSRRQFIKGLAATGVATSLSSAMIPSSVFASNPKKGGLLRIGYAYGNTNDSFQPTIMIDRFTFLLNSTMRNFLVELDHKGNAIPELVENWEISPDFKTWVFNLRKGIEFHNGKTLDAKDVIFSMNIHRGETKSAVKSLLSSVVDIKADGKHRVIFTLEKGNLDFQYILADPHFSISPEGTEGAEWEKCIGTGGYILEHFEPGVKTRARRNPNYWKEGRAHFDGFELTVMHDDSTRTNALRSGKVDYIDQCDPRTAILLKRDKNLQVINKASGDHYTMPMRSDVSPYDKKDVSLAMKYAIDREHLIKILINGFGTLGNDHPIGPIYKYHAKDLPQRQYDPDKAKFHMKKAGLNDHIFELSACANKSKDDLAIAFKEHAAKAGIKINVLKKPSDGYWSNVWLKDPFCVAQWNARSSVDVMFSTAWTKNAKWNECYWQNERFNKLVVDARAERDENLRMEMYVEAQQICRNEASNIVPLFFDHIMAGSKKLKYKNLAGNAADDGHRMIERWWFDS